MLVVRPWPPPPGNNNWVVINLNPNVPPGTGFVNPHPANSMVRVLRQLEGLDADGLPVSRATDHILHLAVKLRGNRQENFFTAHLPYYLQVASPPYPAGIITLPSPPYPPNSITNPFLPIQQDGSPNQYYTPTTFFDQAADARFQDPLPPPLGTSTIGYKTQWAEIAYFLWPNGTSTPNGTPLFALYRAEFKVVPDNRYVNGEVYNRLAANPPGPPPLLAKFGFGTAWNPYPVGDGFNEMSAILAERVYHFINPSGLASNNPRTQGPDRVFTYFYDSFNGRGFFDPANPEVWSATLIATDVVSFDVQILRPGDADFVDLQFGIFDTMFSNYTINAVKITLRVWDLKTHQTRQVTVIQDM
jgi:hypothetical protein